MSLAGQVVVVSGAASGIGRALAQLASARGAAVALSDVNAAGLEETRASLTGEAFAQVVDVAQRAQVEAFAAAVLQRFGRADVVVSNAGVTVSQRTADLTYEDFEWLMGINFWGVVHQVKAFLPHLLQAKRGTLVNVSSLFGLIGWPSQSAYCASKFAVRGFTESLRLELDGTGVKALCVHPGGVATNIVSSARFYVDDKGRPSKAKMERDFGKVARTTPDSAATQILDAVARGEERLLVGPDARALDRLQRWVPTGYFRVVRALERLVRRA